MPSHDIDIRRVLNDLRTGRITRRRALQAFGAAGLSAALLPAFYHRAFGETLTGPGGIPLARPDKPVTLPRFKDPIKSGMAPEKGGTFTLFNYQDYVDKKVIQEFGKKYGIKTQLTTFDNMDECVTRLASRAVKPDVTNLAPDRLAQLVAGKLIQPINLDYIPNLKANVWPSLHSPFYDTGSQYTIPYTVYATGIGWRSDKVSEDIPKLANPFSIFWNSQKYKGYVGILDESREAISLALLYRDNTDINTEDPAMIDKALADLQALIPICNPKINITEYQTLATGDSWLHQSWSGDLLGAFISNLPQGYDGSTLRFWSAEKGKGPVQNDCWAVGAFSKKPVLGHLWLNFLLDQEVAYNNFTQFTGYQVPQNGITADKLIADKVIPENLRSTILTAEAFGPGSLQEMTLTPKGQKLWQTAFARFTSGA